MSEEICLHCKLKPILQGYIQEYGRDYVMQMLCRCLVDIMLQTHSPCQFVEAADGIIKALTEEANEGLEVYMNAGDLPPGLPPIVFKGGPDGS